MHGHRAQSRFDLRNGAVIACLEKIFGQFDRHRTRSVRGGHLKGTLDEFRELVRRGQPMRPLAQGREHGHLIDELIFPAPIASRQPITRHIAHQGDNGDGGVERLCQAGGKFNRAGTDRRIANPDPSGEACVSVGRIHGVALIAHWQVADFRGAGVDGVVKRQRLSARQAEHDRHAVTDEHFHQNVAAVTDHICMTARIAPPALLRAAPKASLICSSG